MAVYISSSLRESLIEKEKMAIEKTQELNSDIHKSLDIPDKERFVSRDTGIVMNGSELFIVTDKQTGKEYMSAQYYGFVELK